MKTISILGCGWLGLPLAELFVKNNYSVNGATTTSSKLSDLKNKKISPYLITCSPEIEGDRLDEFFNCNTLIITLPFKRSFKNPNFYKKQIDSILSKLNASIPCQLLFTSSTSIYSLENSEVDESMQINPTTERQQTLLETEQLILNKTKNNPIILRCGGLYGEKRPIGLFMRHKTHIENPNAPTNLIHQEDVINIIFKLVQSPIPSTTLNLVGDHHPTKKELYTNEAIRLGNPIPNFLENASSPFKIVSNKKVKSLLNYTFIYPDPRSNND